MPMYDFAFWMGRRFGVYITEGCFYVLVEIVFGLFPFSPLSYLPGRSGLEHSNKQKPVTINHISPPILFPRRFNHSAVCFGFQLRSERMHTTRTEPELRTPQHVDPCRSLT
jgi:hypothetical protein